MEKLILNVEVEGPHLRMTLSKKPQGVRGEQCRLVRVGLGFQHKERPVQRRGLGMCRPVSSRNTTEATGTRATGNDGGEGRWWQRTQCGPC